MQQNHNTFYKSEMNPSFEIAVLSDIGDRKEQQDSIGFQLDKSQLIAAVCDGMGGHEGGSIASNIAKNRILTAFRERDPNIENTDWILQSLIFADKEIAAQMKADGSLLHAGSTAVAIWIFNNSLYWGSVGDSRAYLHRGTELVQLTKDQTYQIVLDEKKSAGLLSEQQYALEMQRGETLISFLGIGNLNLIDYSVSPVKLNSGDRIIVMTDGLYKTVPEERMQSILSNFKNGMDAAMALEELSKKNAKHDKLSRDNTTLAIITIL